MRFFGLSSLGCGLALALTGCGSDVASFSQAGGGSSGGDPKVVTAVTAGDSHTCAIVNGGVQCWGSKGQLGNGAEG